jgi:acyl-CoA-dependent ceramide synthase
MTKEGLRRRLNVSESPTIGNRQVKDPKRKKRSLLRRCKRFAVKHTWSLPLALVLAILSLYAQNPSESNILHHFVFLSYKQESDDPTLPTQYGKGLWDVAFVSFYVIVLSFTREFIMQEILRPLARLRIKSRGKQSRFMEQAYTAIYFGVLGPAGLYVMRQTPVWYFNTHGMYESFPHRTHAAEFKFYYLLEAAYWAQQAIVMLLGMEKPRKDFKELVTHHIVTLALIALSYRFHFTYMGIAVYITHDISDFFLAVRLFPSIRPLFRHAKSLLGLEIPPLLRPGYFDPLLRSLDRLLDLSPSCTKSAHPLLPAH